MKEVYIVAAKRTPIGGFLGNLTNYSATELGSIAIQSSYQSINIPPQEIGSVYMGNVLSANVGQAPARQAAKHAGIPDNIDSTTINKVCASGMKAVVIGAQQIQLGQEDIVMAGGMESMSNTPHYSLQRKNLKLGHCEMTDGILKDGLTDVYNNYHMGVAAELCVNKYGISRNEQDEYAIASYEKAAKAWNEKKFNDEMILLNVTVNKKEILMNYDEDVAKIMIEKVPNLKPVFLEHGTITAANASNINDGAAAILLASKEAIEKHQLKPMAKIISYADAAQAPEWFTTSPSIAVQKALNNARISKDEIDYYEINEAYAAVVIANQKILNLPSRKINIYGGAVAMGHPLGASGARIICTLLSVLRQENGKYGVATICNGGGGASAIVIQNLNNK